MRHRCPYCGEHKLGWFHYSSIATGLATGIVAGFLYLVIAA